MTVTSASASAYQNAYLLSMLARLADSQSAASSQSATQTSGAQAQTTVSSPDAAKVGGCAGPALSSQILRVLIAMQAQGGADATAGNAETTTSANTNPAQSLFSAMDTDGDGAVSQTEMESYITGLGGTTEQADALYSSLNQSNAGG